MDRVGTRVDTELDEALSPLDDLVLDRRAELARRVVGASTSRNECVLAAVCVAGEEPVQPRLRDAMGLRDLANAPFVDKHRLDNERCQFYRTPPVVSTMFREMSPRVHSAYYCKSSQIRHGRPRSSVPPARSGSGA